MFSSSGHPEVPSHVRINSTTHNSVTLLWTPGFDGGAPQRFRIRYRRVGREGYKTEEVTPRNATSYVVTGKEEMCFKEDKIHCICYIKRYEIDNYHL